ncbi:MAG: hypothetical protein U5K69_21665 [Balneolaceae bacterium]|nr:hypothetical protein [Balneolaceae bacterium]
MKSTLSSALGGTCLPILCCYGFIDIRRNRLGKEAGEAAIKSLNQWSAAGQKKVKKGSDV